MTAHPRKVVALAHMLACFGIACDHSSHWVSVGFGVREFGEGRLKFACVECGAACTRDQPDGLIVTFDRDADWWAHEKIETDWLARQLPFAEGMPSRAHV